MKLKVRLVALGAFFVVLIGLAAWSRAQTAVAPNPVPPVVLAGPDIGFRMTGVETRNAGGPARRADQRRVEGRGVRQRLAVRSGNRRSRQSLIPACSPPAYLPRVTAGG